MLRHVRRSWDRKARLAPLFLVATALATLFGGATMGQGAVSLNTLESLGVYTGYQSPGTTNSFSAALGNQPVFGMDFLDGSSWSSLVNSAPSYMSAWSRSGYSMVWGVPMLPDSFSPDSDPADTSGSAYGLAQGAAGSYNSYFLKLAQEMVAGGQGSSIVRLGWEFNGGWFPWSAKGQAAAFVGYWRQVVDTMRSVPGQDLRFEWNPTAGDEGVGNLADFYPGNASVDYIGLDLYDQAWATYPGITSQWNTFLTEPYGLDWLASFATSMGKPITLPEWGLDPEPSSNDGGPVSDPGTEVGGGDDPTFIDDMAQWISQNDVFDATYWDYGSSRLGASTNPKSFAAFAADFGGAPDAALPPPSIPATDPPTTDTSGTTSTTGPTGHTGPTGRTGASAGSETGSSLPPSAIPPTSNGTESIVTIKQSPSPIAASKEVQFSARIRRAHSGPVVPAGRVSWRITAASGVRIPCRSGDQGRVRAQGRTRCTVPGGKLSAADGPYTVSVRYAGAADVAPSSATLTQSVVKASSTTAIESISEVPPGNMVEIVAAVKAPSAGSTMPSGSVRFALWDQHGHRQQCLGGNTASLGLGVALCVVAGTAPFPGVSHVRATYNGDDNFVSSRSGTSDVVVPPRPAAAPPS